MSGAPTSGRSLSLELIARGGRVGIITCALATSGCLSGERYLALPNMPPEGLRRLERMEQLELRKPSVEAVEVASLAALEAIALRDERPSLALSIARARADALRHNPALAAERVREWVARSRLEEEIAKFDPVIRAAMAVYGPSEQVLAGPFKPFEAQVDLALPLPTNGELSAGVFSGLEDSLLAPRLGPGVSITLSQPLLVGVGLRAASYSIRVAGLEAIETLAGIKTRVADILRRVDRAYWSVYELQGRRAVRWSQYELARKHLEDARQRVSIGAVPGVEVVRAEAGLASRADDVIVANADVEQAELTLKELMSRPDVALDASLALLLTTRPDPSPIEFDQVSFYERATANRAELVRLSVAEELADAEFALRRDALWPRMDLIASYSYVPENFATDLAGELSGEEHRAFLGVRVEAPLGQRAASARETQARLGRQQRELQTRAGDLQIRRELAAAHVELDVTWKRIGVTAQDSIFARRNYDAERRQFELGTNTTTDVLIAARELGSAEIRAIEAQARYEVAKVSLAFATGTALAALPRGLLSSE